MAKKPEFDHQIVHKYYSTECFNHAWDYIDKPERSKHEEDRMLQLCLASLWHWTQRKDHSPTNLSIGYWQASRVFALLKQAELARWYGEFCLEAAQNPGVEPFYRGYAFEALARSEMIAGSEGQNRKYMMQARQIAATLSNLEEKKRLSNDLDTIR